MQKSKSIAGKILFAVFVIVFVGIIVLPFFWQFMTSIKPLSEISAIPAKWIPSKVHWDFYKNVFTKHPFGRYLLNSFIVALSTTVLSILIGASAAYALARLRFKGKKIMLMAILSISMFPTIATLSPIYLLLKNLKLLNTYAGLIIPYITFALPLSIWLLTNFFAQLPKGFEEAAAIDGCSRGKIFFTIMLPLIKPATFSVALIVFINAWNEYLYPYYILQKPSKYTLVLLIRQFFGGADSAQNMHGAAAAAVLCVLPLVVAYLCLQKYFIQGQVDSAVK